MSLNEKNHGRMKRSRNGNWKFVSFVSQHRPVLLPTITKKMLNNPCGLDSGQNQGGSKNSSSLFQVGFAPPPQFFGVIPVEPGFSLTEFPLN